MNKLFVLVGPSAAGKTLISNFIVHKNISALNPLIDSEADDIQILMLKNLGIIKENLSTLDIKKIITSTSRDPRINESHGVDYYFYTREHFQEKIKDGHFLEYVENFGNYYGTSLASIEATLEKNSSVIVLDEEGASKMKNLIGNKAITIYFDVSVDTMKKRMDFRNEDETSLNLRLSNLEICKFKNQADHIINADNRIDITLLDLLNTIKCYCHCK